MLSSLTIGVLGGSGRTGQTVIEESLTRGHRVVTLVRSPEKILQKNITVLQGDATNSTDIKKILEQVDILIDTVSVSFFHQSPTTLFSKVSKAIISARPQGTASHLIIMSSAGTHHGRNLPRPENRGYELFLGDVANDKEKAEALYQGSDLPRTYLKAPLLTSGKRIEYTTIPFSAYTPTLFDTISRKTIATCILDIAEKNLFVQQKITPLVRK